MSFSSTTKQYKCNECGTSVESKDHKKLEDNQDVVKKNWGVVEK